MSTQVGFGVQAFNTAATGILAGMGLLQLLQEPCRLAPCLAADTLPGTLPSFVSSSWALGAAFSQKYAIISPGWVFASTTTLSIIALAATLIGVEILCNNYGVPPVWTIICSLGVALACTSSNIFEAAKNARHEQPNSCGC